MVRATFKHGTPREEPGTWEKGTRDGKPSVLISCPICKACGMLTKHEITPAGLVQPSVVCTSEDCGFHEFIILQGWKP